MFIEDFVSRVKGHDDMMWISKTPLNVPMARRSCIMDVWGQIIILPSDVVDQHTWDELERLVLDAAETKARRGHKYGGTTAEAAEAGVEESEGR